MWGTRMQSIKTNKATMRWCDKWLRLLKITECSFQLTFGYNGVSRFTQFEFWKMLETMHAYHNHCLRSCVCVCLCIFIPKPTNTGYIYDDLCMLRSLALFCPTPRLYMVNRFRRTLRLHRSNIDKKKSENISAFTRIVPSEREIAVWNANKNSW